MRTSINLGAKLLQILHICKFWGIFFFFFAYVKKKHYLCSRKGLELKQRRYEYDYQ